jgi:hypothetical protein
MKLFVQTIESTCAPLEPPPYDLLLVQTDDVVDFNEVDEVTAPYPQRTCTVCGGVFVCFVGANLCDMCTDFLWIAKHAVITEASNVGV